MRGLVKLTEILDSYVMCIRQVATLSAYGEPHILVCRRLYWVIFPTEDLRQVVEMVKRILIKNI